MTIDVHSLRRRLPLLIGGLVLAVAVTFSWAAVIALRRTTLAAGAGRLGTVADQLATSLEASLRASVDSAAKQATDPAFVAYLAHPSARTRGPALTALRRDPTQASRASAATLFDAARGRVLHVALAPPVIPPAADSALWREFGGSDSAMMGGFAAIDDSLIVPVTAPVRQGGRVAGYLVRWHRVGMAPNQSARTSALLGSGARFVLGTETGDFWTDLVQRQPAPPAAVLNGRGVHTYPGADGAPVIAVARHIRPGPWVLVVEFPFSAVLEPVRGFQRFAVLLGAILVAFGLLSAWLVSRSLTRPLRALTDAATGITAGDYSGRVAVDRRDELGQLAQAFNTMADRVRESQRGMEERVALVDNAPHGIFRATAGGRIVAVNAALVRLLGYDSEADLLTRNMVSDVYLSAVDRDRVLSGARDGRAHPAEVMWRRKDGSRITVRVTPYVVHLPGDEPTYESIVEDVSTQRDLEQQLRQAQKMEAIGRLAGGLAHDFNNLLTAIMGSAEALMETLPADAAQRQEVDVIQGEARRAADLTRQVLAFSRQQVLAPQVVDVNGLILGVGKLLRRLIGEDIELQLSPMPNVGAVVVDPGQLEQVILNLAVNARDAMPGGGRLTIETASIELDDDYAEEHVGVAAGPHVAIAVTDTGTGMDADTKLHLFEPFFTTKERGKGTGLGLATVYGIVKQSGGHIWVYSEIGHGTTFKVYLPRAAGAPRHTPEPMPAPALGGGEVILLVEDEPGVRRAARRALERFGYKVLEADGPEAALRTAESDEHIDLLVTDVVMPGMSGREVAERIVAKRPALKVLYMSGYTDDTVVRNGAVAGGVAFLQKPFTPQGLARKVREVLDQTPVS